jgi:methionyl-tRNA formyltransferase
MRVVFLGNARWSVPSLEALASSGHDLALVLTRSARRGGRGSRLLRTPVAEAAERLGVPRAEVETVKSGEGFAALKESSPDVMAVVAYGEILPLEVLRIPAVAPVNLHFSLLPELRGAAPVQWALRNGVAVTGVTTIRMDEGMDTGPILLQAEEAVREDDDAGRLGARLAERGADLLVQTVDGLQAGSIDERPQDDGAATYAPKLNPEDRVIDWARPSDLVVRQVRAMAPEPGAQTTLRDRLIKVLRASVVDAPAGEESSEPGSIVEASNEGLIVQTEHGKVRLDELAPEGRKRMSGADFVRGYRPKVGEVLGSS